MLFMLKSQYFASKILMPFTFSFSVCIFRRIVYRLCRIFIVATPDKLKEVVAALEDGVPGRRLHYIETVQIDVDYFPAVRQFFPVFNLAALK